MIPRDGTFRAAWASLDGPTLGIERRQPVNYDGARRLGRGLELRHVFFEAAHFGDQRLKLGMGAIERAGGGVHEVGRG
jgi:hypothetical protein